MIYCVHVDVPERLCSKIEKYRERFSHPIEIPSMLPHVTVMAGWFKAQNESRVVSVLEQACYDRFAIQLGGVDRFDENVVVRANGSRELVMLHYYAIQSLKGLLNRKEVSKYNVRGLQAEIAREYGSPFCAGFYEPHVTVGRIDPKEVFEVPAQNYFRGNSWTVDRFCLSKKDGEWTKVKEFLLKKE